MKHIRQEVIACVGWEPELNFAFLVGFLLVRFFARILDFHLKFICSGMRSSKIVMLRNASYEMHHFWNCQEYTNKISINLKIKVSFSSLLSEAL